MYRKIAARMFLLTSFFVANFILVNLVFAQNISQLCDIARQDMILLNNKLNSDVTLVQLNTDVGTILEMWKVKYDDLDKQCTNIQCLQNSELWNKTQTARQMKFYISNIGELISSGLSKNEILQKIDKFSKDIEEDINRICSGKK
jgi:hypothetical protein